jgi:hypothetical protein
VRKEVLSLYKKYNKFIDFYKKDDPRAESYEESIWNAINSKLELQEDEIIYIARTFPSGELDDLTDDLIALMVKSSYFKNTNVFDLKNFGDPLLELKSEAILAGNQYQFSQLEKDTSPINFENFWDKMQEASPNFTNLDIDYILAMLNTGKFEEINKLEVKKINLTIKKAIDKNHYQYLSYFTEQGLDALEKLDLYKRQVTGKKKLKFIPPKNYDPFKFY